MRFFGATALFEKISKQWEEVPESQHLALRSQIIHFLKIPGTSNIVLSKLCKSVSSINYIIIVFE